MLKKYLSVFLFQLFAINTASACCDNLRIVETLASDNLISNQLLREKFETLGYTIEIIPVLKSKEAYELLRLNKADIYLGTWIPLDSEAIKPYLLKGQVKTLNKILSNIQIGIAVNAYASALGVISIEQLKSTSGDLEHVIYVGKSDWEIAKKLENILSNSMNGLHGFKVIRVTDEALEMRLHRAELNKKPIIFYTRKINIIDDKYAKNFLFNTVNGIEEFHSQMTIYSTVRHEFSRQCPEATSIVRDFRVEASKVL